MKRLLFLLVLLPTIFQAQTLYKYESEQQQLYYAIPYRNAQRLDYWARKGILADTLIIELNKGIDFNQANSDLLYKQLKDCAELSNKTITINKKTEVDLQLLQSKYATLEQEYNFYKKRSTNSMITLGVALGAMLGILVLVK